MKSLIRTNILPLLRAWNRGAFALLALTFACLVFLPLAGAVTPPPDGGYPNQNTAEGDSALLNLSSGYHNTALGFNALLTTTTGTDNTATGYWALFNDTFGRLNTATGSEALFNNTGGEQNTATGYGTLYSNTMGSYNTATGIVALYYNTTGYFNTAEGYEALERNTTGSSNTAIGLDALTTNTTGNFNTAGGAYSLVGNTTGNWNTAFGSDALHSSFTGSYNTATGSNALYSDSTGSNNTATGHSALFGDPNGSTGDNNTGIGTNALFSYTIGSNNTASGVSALSSNTSGSFNTALGSNAGANLTIGDHNIDIGADVLGLAGEAYTTRIGRQGIQKTAFIAGVAGVPVSGREVIVASNGKLGVAASSARFKEAIKPMDRRSEVILDLKPVTFRYKEEIDPAGIPQFGLVAEEVEKVNPELVDRDEEGKPYTVRYESVNAMLLNEFIKEHKRVQELEAKVAQQKTDFEAATLKQTAEMANVVAGLKEQGSEIRRVKDQLALSKGRMQVVADER